MTPINILILVRSPVTATEYFRLQLPFYRLNDQPDFKVSERVEIDSASTDFLKQFQFVVFSKFISVLGQNEKVIKRLNSLGITVIMDIDDYWVTPKYHPMYLTYKKVMAERVIYCLKNSDHVTTTNPILAGEVSKYNKNVTVIQNAIDPLQPQFQPRITKSEVVRLGWVGGIMHEQDLKLVKKAFKLLHEDKNINFQTYLMGFNSQDGGMYKKYGLILTDNGKYLDNFSMIYGNNVMSYADGYNYFDIAFVPLVNNKFNACKSELKLIECGFMKKASVISNVPAYSGIVKDHVNCITVDNGLMGRANRWKDSVKQLINEPNLREDLAQNLYETVKVKYSLETTNAIRSQLLKSLI